MRNPLIQKEWRVVNIIFSLFFIGFMMMIFELIVTFVKEIEEYNYNCLDCMYPIFIVVLVLCLFYFKMLLLEVYNLLFQIEYDIPIKLMLLTIVYLLLLTALQEGKNVK